MGIAVWGRVSDIIGPTKIMKRRNERKFLSFPAYLILYLTVLTISDAAEFNQVDKIGEDNSNKRINWSPGTFDERSLQSAVLTNKRVKRYDKNAWKSWQPGDPDPWADTKADHERQYNRDRAANRRRQEANRRHKEERAKSDAYLNEVANRRKNRTFTGPIIGVSCFVGVFVCCCCIGLCLKCRDDYGVGYGSEAYRSRSNQHQLQAVQPSNTQNTSSSPQRMETTTKTSSPQTAQATAPLLPSSIPPSEENGSELPPSYADAIADTS